MATFNPDVPNIEPKEYLRVPQGIRQPESSKSTAYALEGAGKVIEEGAKAADWYVKGVIDDQIHAGVDTIRDKYTSDLQNVYDKFHTAAATQSTSSAAATTQPGQIPGSAPTVPADKFSILGSSNEPNVPGELRNLPSMLGSLDAAKASGKYSKTYLDAQYDTLAKDFRSRYPGYRDYIDQKFESTTGSNPANARITSMLSDINSFVTQRNAQNQHIDNIISGLAKEGNIPMSNLYAKRASGNIDNAADMRAVAENQAWKYQFEKNRLIFGDYKNNQEMQTMWAKRAMPETAHGLSGQYVSNMVIADPTTGKARNLTEYLDKVLTGKEKAPDNIQAEQMAKLIEANAMQYEAEVRKHFNSIEPNSKQPYRAIAGDDETEKFIKSGREPFKTLQDAVFKGDFTLASSTANLIKHRGDNALLALMNIPGSGASLSILTGAARIDPKFMELLYSRNLIGSMAIPDKNITTDIGNRLSMQNSFDIRVPATTPAPASTGTPTNVLPGPNTKVFTATEAHAGATTMGASPDVHKAISTLMPTLIADAKTPMPVKVSLARAYFDPSNKDYINLFADDQVVQGKYRMGKQTVFNTLTSEGMSKAVLETARASGDVKIWNNYKEWVNHTYGANLYPSYITQLNSVMGTKLGYDVRYDTDTHHFELVDTKRKPTNIYDAGIWKNPAYKRKNDELVRRINEGNDSLANIAKAEGSNADEYILGLMIATRGQLDIRNISNPETLPEQLYKAIIKANTKPEPAKAEEPAPKPARPRVRRSEADRQLILDASKSLTGQ